MVFGLRTIIQSIASMAQPKVVFVLGGPGAGKGTQCQRIVKVSSIIIVQQFIKSVVGF